MFFLLILLLLRKVMDLVVMVRKCVVERRLLCP
jgi:hypothetical protein